MQLQSQLVHAEPGPRVVLVSAWQQGACLGSAVGEGSSAEAAEDRAIDRLLSRLSPDAEVPIATEGATAATARPPAPRQAPLLSVSPEPAVKEPSSPSALRPNATDPEDWSDELTEVELQLKRLGWGREQEATYLARAFGHPSRSRLIRYADLLAYRNALRQLAEGSDPALVPPPLRRPELLGQCDQLLGQLRWGASQGREFLEKHFALASRQQLSDEQLLQFNMLLEGVLIGELPVL